MARDRCVASLQEYQQRMRDLGEQPRSLRDFADYCDSLNRVKEERDKEAVTSAYRPSTPRSEEHTLMPSTPRPPRDKVKGGDAATPPTQEASPPHVSVQSDVSEDGTLVVQLF